MTKEEFIKDVNYYVNNRPAYIRYGQAVFNYIESEYHVARIVQFNGIDCFYDDSKVNKFLDAAYNEINSLN